MFVHTFTVRKDRLSNERRFEVEKPESSTDLEGWRKRIGASSDEELLAKINDLAFAMWLAKWQKRYRAGRSRSPNDWKY